jgi:hypothetical protein
MAILTIQVKPHIAKYLDYLYGHCFNVTRKEYVGIMLSLLLSRNSIRNDYNRYMKYYTHPYKLRISGSFIYDKGVRYITSYCTVQFNNYIEGLFKDEFHQFVSIHELNGKTIKYAVEMFRDKYSLSDEDLSFATMLRSYQRHKEKILKNDRSVCHF